MPAPRASRFQIGDNWPVLVFVGLLAVLIGLKGRFTGFDAHSLSVNAMPLTLIALGQFLVVLTRGVDLSLGPVASVAGAAMALTVTDHPVLGLAAPVLIGLVAGLINGLFVARLGLPPIIVTLATMSVWQGVALIVLPNPGGSVPTAFQAMITGGFSSPVAGVAGVFLCIVGGTWLLSTPLRLASSRRRRRRTRRPHERRPGGECEGRRLCARGPARGARRHVSRDRHRQRFARPQATAIILTSIAAVVIGGVPLSGGRGTAARRRDGRTYPDHHRQPALFRRHLLVLSKRHRWPDPARRRRQRRDPRMAALDRGGARMTVSEESRPMNAVRPAVGARGFRAAAPALLIVFSLVLVFVGERLAPGFATVDQHASAR